MWTGVCLEGRRSQENIALLAKGHGEVPLSWKSERNPMTYPGRLVGLSCASSKRARAWSRAAAYELQLPFDPDIKAQPASGIKETAGAN